MTFVVFFYGFTALVPIYALRDIEEQARESAGEDVFEGIPMSADTNSFRNCLMTSLSRLIGD